MPQPAGTLTPVQATYPRPVAMPNGKTLRIRQRARGLTGWLTSTSVQLADRARRPVLTIGSMAAGCHAAWQIWHPLGWVVVAGCGLWLERITGPEGDA